MNKLSKINFKKKINFNFENTDAYVNYKYMIIIVLL